MNAAIIAHTGRSPWAWHVVEEETVDASALDRGPCAAAQPAG